MNIQTNARRTRENRVRWLIGKISELESDLQTFREMGSATAVTAMHKEIRTHRAELDSLSIELAEQDDAAQVVAAEDLSPEEWVAKVRADAQAASDEDLEVYVHEWLDRSGMRIVHDKGGARLARAS